MSLDKFNPQSMSDDHLLPATLLEMGDTLNFIETRKHTLRAEIKQSKTDAGVGKVSGLLGMAGGCGLLVLSNPLGSLVIAGGVVAYGVAVFAQWLQTGKVQPMPLSSKTQDDRDLELSGSTITGQSAYEVSSINDARSAIAEQAAYLDDREKIEYELLHFAPEGLLSAMNHVHPTQRWACYQFLVDAFLAGTIQSYFANPQALRDVLGSPEIYTSHLPEASKRFPQYGLPSAGAMRGEEARSSFQPPTVPAQIGPDTKLGRGVVDVPVQSSTNQPQQWQPPQLPTDDIARSLAEHLQSTLIVGQPGAGKGLTIAYATRIIKQLHPSCEIWAIDPKSDPSEAAYWLACDRILNCPIQPFATVDEMAEIKLNIESFIAAFQASSAPMKLLIFDEALAVKEKSGSWFKGLMAGFNALCSMGRSSKQYGWLVSQSPNADDYGISGGTRNVYRRVLLIAKSNQGLLANGSTFFSGKPTEQQLNVTGRVFFDSAINGWGITPVYPDLVDGSKKSEAQPSRREMLERSLSVEIPSPQHEQVYHSSEIEPEGNETDADELAVRAEIKRFLLANPEGSKPRDLARIAKKPVRGMPVDDIKFVLDLMTLEGEIYEVDGTYFANTN